MYNVTFNKEITHYIQGVDRMLSSSLNFKET